MFILSSTSVPNFTTFYHPLLQAANDSRGEDYNTITVSVCMYRSAQAGVGDVAADRRVLRVFA